MMTLSKSRFVQGWSCPRKVYYGSKGKVYRNLSGENPFLQSLAEGGFQVGELAKCYKPGGRDIKTLDEKLAISQTYEELQKDNAIIYEGAFLWNNCFVRADIIVKNNDNIYLYELSTNFAPVQAKKF